MLDQLLERWRAARRRKISARWLVRMHGPDAFRWRGRFEAWRQADSKNALAYDRQLQIWSLAPRLGAAESTEFAKRQVSPYAMAASIAAIAAGLGGAAYWSLRTAAPLEIVADDQSPKTVRLADGSSVMLARGSTLQVAFDEHVRRLALTRGRMRLQLRKETRPGLLRAGPVVVRMDIASVDVSVAHGVTRVILLDGLLRLARYDADERADGVVLKPGELAEVDGRPAPITPRRAQAADVDWPSGMISFDDAPLSEVLAQANAVSLTRIATEQRLGQERVTGAYHMGDNEGLARSLAASLGLSISRASDGALLLRRNAR